MEQIQDLVARKIAEIRNRNGSTTLSTTTDMTPEEWLEMRVKAYNSAQGDKYPCDECLGRGTIAFIEDGEMRVRLCRCEVKRRNMNRVKRSGLGEMFENCRMDNFDTNYDWQKTIKEKAMEYIYSGGGWYLLCGRAGSGKTHLTAAIAREMLLAGRETRYFMWREDAPRLKAIINDAAKYDERMRELTDCSVLLIDDLFKGKVTDADVNLAFEMLNARYNSPSKRTVISTEKTAEELLQLDEAVGSRILERSRGYILQTGDVNLRLGG